MDTSQTLLVIVLILTSLFLAIIGTQFVLTLIEIRRTLRKISKVIDGFESLGVNVNESFHEMSGFVGGFKTILKLIEVSQSHKYEK